MLHTDGAPVTKVGGKSLWPVQCTIVEIPPPIRDSTNATMILAAWLGGSHPNRNHLWNNIVDQITQLLKNGINIVTDDGKIITFNVRVQFITFDLPALAHHCNIIQFNGYNACPDCTMPGVLVDRQVMYPYTQDPFPPKLDKDYINESTKQQPTTAIKGIKGPTPLTNILIFPIQIAKDYMHLVCSGHMKTLLTYWKNHMLSNVFDRSSNYLVSVILPHSFGYQFMPLIQFHQWKTKMFR